LTATATGSSHSWSTLFRPALIDNGTNNFSGWQIGAVTGEDMGTAFDAEAELTAMATSSSNNSWATLFGPAHINSGNNVFFDWRIGQFAGEAMLTDTATSSSYSWAILLGPANINNSTNNFSGWQIGPLTGEDMGTAFGGKATLIATATTSSSSFSSHYRLVNKYMP
jgi:hypothetical protein